MNPILSSHDGKTKFEVFFDPEPMFESDFETIEEEIAYKERFETEELIMYGLVKYDICPCCNIWREVDSLWSIDAESPEEVLEYYRNYI